MFLSDMKLKKCVVIVENDGTLKLVPDCNNNQKLCNKAVDNFVHVLEFIPASYQTQKYVDTFAAAML